MPKPKKHKDWNISSNGIKLTLKDVESGIAAECERCGQRMWYEDALFHEYYGDKNLTDLHEEIVYCRECAKLFFNKEELEYGAKKEYAYSW